MFEDETYFDFEEKDELPENLNYNQLQKCPHCKKPIPNNAIMCLYCGESVNRGNNRQHSWVIWIIIAIVIVFLVMISW